MYDGVCFCFVFVIVQVELDLVSTVQQQKHVLKTQYYIPASVKPYSFVEYEVLGPILYTNIVNELKKMCYWFHEYHKCQKCGRCHKCQKCGYCKIIGKKDECLNCRYKWFCEIDAQYPSWDTNDLFEWRMKNKLYVNNQELYYTGFGSYENVYDIRRMEQVTEQIKNMPHQEDGTVEKVKGKEKYYLGAGYEYSQDHKKKNKKWKHAGTIRTNVDGIPSFVLPPVLLPLQRQGIIRANSVNALLVVDYHYDGLENHFDGKNKFDLKSHIVTIRMLNDAALRVGCQKRWGKNALMLLVLKRGIVLKMNRLTYGSDWIKHCMNALDFAGPNEVMVLRRVYPILLASSKQCDNKF